MGLGGTGTSFELGEDGIFDRWSRPETSPHRTLTKVEDRSARSAGTRISAPDSLGAGVPVLHGPSGAGAPRPEPVVSHIDRQSGQQIRRYERKRAGELVQVKVKRLGRILKGGRHKVRGREACRKGKDREGRVGFAYVDRPSTITPALPTPRPCPTRPLPPRRP